jgi:NB-ARC domain
MQIKTKIQERLDNAKSNGDAYLCEDCILILELIIKLHTFATLGLLQKHKEKPEYKKIVASINQSGGTGDWSRALHEIMTGPLYRYIDNYASKYRDELLNDKDNPWTLILKKNLEKIFEIFEIELKLGQKTNLLKLFSHIVELRNKTRGHGGHLAEKKVEASPFLYESIIGFLDSSKYIKELVWLHLHKNVANTNAVSWLAGNKIEILNQYLNYNYNIKNANDKLYLIIEEEAKNLKNFEDIDLILRPLPDDLYICGSDKLLYLNNGNFQSGTCQCEYLCIFNGKIQNKSVSHSDEPTKYINIPFSSTSAVKLQIKNNVLTNIPDSLPNYIDRKSLETELLSILKNKEQNAIITITGRGGIGKTSLVLKVLNRDHISGDFFYVLWFSARDIDLNDTGAQIVRPDIYSIREIGKKFRDTILEVEPEINSTISDKDVVFMQKYLAEEGKKKPVLIVLDNFETVEDEKTIFKWFYENVRNPNKILITSRLRTITGDYNIKVGGMSNDEAKKLIYDNSQRLGISSFISDSVVAEIIQRSSSHPYVMKQYLVSFKNNKKLGPPEKSISDDILENLFERSYNLLNNREQYLFLILSSWASPVFKQALSAVLNVIEPGVFYEIDDIVDALDSNSMIVIHNPDSENEMYDLASTARAFGKSKIKLSSHLNKINEIKTYLQLFGPVSTGTLKSSLPSRAHLFINNCVSNVRSNTIHSTYALSIYVRIADKNPELLESALLFAKSIKTLRMTKEVNDIYEKVLERIISSSSSVVPSTLKVESYSELAKRYFEEKKTKEGFITLANAISSEDAFIQNDVAICVLIRNAVYCNKIFNYSSNLARLTKRELEQIFNGAFKRVREVKVVKMGAVPTTDLLWFYQMTGKKQEFNELLDVSKKVFEQDEHIQRLYPM